MICKEVYCVFDAVINEAEVVNDVPLENHRVFQECCVLTNYGRDILNTLDAVCAETAKPIENLEPFIYTEEDTVDGKVRLDGIKHLLSACNKHGLTCQTKVHLGFWSCKLGALKEAPDEGEDSFKGVELFIGCFFRSNSSTPAG